MFSLDLRRYVQAAFRDWIDCMTRAENALELDCDHIADIFAELTVKAAIDVMEIYAGEANAREKPDKSVVCDADERAEVIILKGLAEQLPDLPVVAEEAASRGEKPRCGHAFVLVDPVDGTREFLNRNGEFTINIGLVVDGIPRAGAVYAPALGRLWVAGVHASMCAIAPGGTLPPFAQRQEIKVRAQPSQGLTAVASRSHSDEKTEAFLSQLPIAERRSAGSSLKFCLVAAGEADVYPRFGPTMEWDTAAGDAVLRAAGGSVLDEGGSVLRYGKSEAQYRNGAFVAWGRRPATAA